MIPSAHQQELSAACGDFRTARSGLPSMTLQTKAQALPARGSIAHYSRTKTLLPRQSLSCSCPSMISPSWGSMSLRALSQIAVVRHVGAAQYDHSFQWTHCARRKIQALAPRSSNAQQSREQSAAVPRRRHRLGCRNRCGARHCLRQFGIGHGAWYCHRRGARRRYVSWQAVRLRQQQAFRRQG